jgi:hypothetical protein
MLQAGHSPDLRSWPKEAELQFISKSMIALSLLNGLGHASPAPKKQGQILGADWLLYWYTGRGWPNLSKRKCPSCISKANQPGIENKKGRATRQS